MGGGRVMGTGEGPYLGDKRTDCRLAPGGLEKKKFIVSQRESGE